MWIAVSPSTPRALTPSTPARAPSRRGAVQAIRNVARASTSSSFLVLSDDESLAHSCARAVKTSADARVIIVITESSTESRETVRVERRGPDAYALVASGEDAATCAADPTEGLLAKLGARIGLAIVATREACLGEDGETKAAMRAARRVAVCGAPVVLFSAPRGNGKREGADDETRCESLNSLVSELVSNVLPGDFAPQNSPRSHFPFPTRSRWAALGTTQLALDDDLAEQVLSDVEDFAAADCWSLGGLGTTPHARSTSSSAEETPNWHREALRDAFREADVFVTLCTPPSWENSGKLFASTRPGVFWRQQQVSTRGDGGAQTTVRDPFGRTLPMQNLSSSSPTRADESNARFVRQLATERVLADRCAITNIATDVDAEDIALPSEFVLSRGVVVADDSPSGDVDVFARGRASVCLRQTFPCGHAFALLDRACVEHLRERSPTGLPLWTADAAAR